MDGLRKNSVGGRNSLPARTLDCGSFPLVWVLWPTLALNSPWVTEDPNTVPALTLMWLDREASRQWAKGWAEHQWGVVTSITLRKRNCLSSSASLQCAHQNGSQEKTPCPSVYCERPQSLFIGSSCIWNAVPCRGKTPSFYSLSFCAALVFVLLLLFLPCLFFRVAGFLSSLPVWFWESEGNALNYCTALHELYCAVLYSPPVPFVSPSSILPSSLSSLFS